MTEILKIEWAGNGRNPGYFVRFAGRPGTVMVSRCLLEAGGYPAPGDRVEIEWKHGMIWEMKIL